MPGDAAFCDGCGHRLESASAATPEGDPRDYTPKHLADKILRSKSALEGERKQVTVLFADVKGSMDLASELDPEEWRGILERFFALANEGVHRFEGTVNQYLGDGVMALFGAPIAHEDHAQRACYAALHLRDTLRRYADELRLERGLPLATRMGLNSGEVVVGKIGDDLRMDYTAQGQVVNVASRMEQLAESGRIYVTKQTADRVSGYFRLREIGPTRIKGVREPLGVFELEDVGEFQGRFDVSRARGLSRFVGRELEMAQLEAALERGLGDRCRFVGIVAEAGTGKSRLVYEFSQRCLARGLRMITAACPPHGRSIPLGLSMAATRSQFGISESDDRETARNKIAGQMSRADPALAMDVPFMFDLLGLAEPGSSSVPLDPDVRLREFVRIIERLCGPEAFQVLVFEDLHWRDPASESMTVQISRTDLPNRRLKIFTYRPEYRPPEADWPEYEEIRLQPLSAESTTALARELLGTHASTSGLEDLIQQRAIGNPFFVEEIVHSLVESGQLDGAPGSYRLVRPIEDVDVPDSVQAVLAARIDRLDEASKRTLQAAALFGLEFAVSLLEEVVEIPRRDLDLALHALAAADLVYQLTAYPEVEYAFKHPLTQSVAKDTQLGGARRRIHARIAVALERRHADKLDEKAGLIAYHWEEGGEHIAAARWHARAARWLETRDVDGALRHWRKARSLLGERDLSSQEAELATVACAQVLNLGWRQGMAEEEAARVFAEGERFADGGAGARAHALLLYAYGTYRGINHSVKEMVDWNDRALEIAGQLDDPSLPLALLINRVVGLQFMGRLRESLEQAEQGIEGTRAQGLEETLRWDSFHVVSQLTFQVGVNLLGIGRCEEARASLEEAVSLARHHRDSDTTCFAQSFLAECCAALGDLEAAVRHGREAIEVAEQYTSHHSAIWAYRGLGRALIAHGRPDEACTVLEMALATLRDRRIHVSLEAELLQLLAEAHLDLGQHDLAREECSEAIAAALRSGTPVAECDAQLVLARVLLREETSEPLRPGDIGAGLERASALVDQTEAGSRRPLLEEVRAALAQMQDDGAGHERHLREAHRLYSEMGAAGHAARLEKELAG